MNIFGLLSTPLGWILQQLYGVVGNYGISLIILTVVIKIAMYPLYKKQILSTMGMSELAPKMKVLQQKYANDREMLNQKMSELYKEEGANPMAGCLPMAIQMIVIMGLFSLLRNPLTYVTSKDMYFAVHESFIWINDLSQPDPWILPLMAGVATFISFYMSSINGAMPGQSPNQSKGITTVMKYGFPIMIVWLAKTYAAGLAIYWFLSQFIQIFYNIRFNEIKKHKAAEAEKKKYKKVRR